MKRKLGLTVGVAILTACTPTWRAINVNGELPEIEFKFDSMPVARFSVEKLVVKNSESDSVKYWSIFSPNLEVERRLERIRYSHVPIGYEELVESRKLEYGLYRVSAAASSELFGGGEFGVVNRDERPVIVNLNIKDMPVTYAQFIECIKKYEYKELEVDSVCSKGAQKP